MHETSTTSRSDRRVLAHTRLLGVATARSVARACFGGDREQARRVLAGLVARQAIYRHRLQGIGPAAYYSTNSVALRRRELREQLALLRFGYGRRRLRPYLEGPSFDNLVGEVACSNDGVLPPWQPCIILRRNGQSVLSLTVVGRSNQLQRCLVHLGQLVNTPAFDPYRPFAHAGRFILTFLLPGPASAASELDRWVRRSPLVSRGATSLAVPVMIHASGVSLAD